MNSLFCRSFCPGGASKLGGAAVLGVLASTCAVKVPEPSVRQDLPHISWTVSTSATLDGSGVIVCDSVQRKPCVLPASTPERRTYVHVTLFLHPTTVDTKYVGAIWWNFSSLSAGERAVSINQVVPPKKVPIRAVVTGWVVESPGEYKLAIVVTASSPPTAKPVEIQDQSPVVVNTAATPQGRQ